MENSRYPFIIVVLKAFRIYLDKLFNQYVSIVRSLTSVLALGEVILQAICARYGLTIEAKFIWIVRVLMIIFYPIAWD
uniref:CNNM transmembrane domain-containing protein n=1 Tax=Quercus lobata TaxID=97700 RepID=A0A7N2LFK6_QUELO